MTTRVTITRANVFSPYGILIPIGTTYTADSDGFALSLIRSGAATDTDSVLELTTNNRFSAAGKEAVEPLSRNIVSADYGKTLECKAAITFTVPAGLPAGFWFNVIPFGTTTAIASGSQTVLLNGATTTVTRSTATAANAIFMVYQRATLQDSYIVTGA